MSARLSVPATARTMTEPPSPPSPPSGPPLGTYFSRRKLQQPAPPSPPLTNNETRSTNMRCHYLREPEVCTRCFYDTHNTKEAWRFPPHQVFSVSPVRCLCSKRDR